MATEAIMSNGLTPQDFHSVRSEISNEGVKGLFLMNGGGAVALLAFLQAIWKDQPFLAKFVLIGIAVMAGGLFFAGFINFFRYHASLNFQGGNTKTYHLFRCLSLSFQYISLLAFAAAIIIVVWGAWSLLPK